MRVLPHIKKLDDALGDFFVRVVCACGASREIEPQALARLGRLKDDSPRARATDAGARGAEIRPPRSWGLRDHDRAVEVADMRSASCLAHFRLLRSVLPLTPRLLNGFAELPHVV